MGYSSTQSRSLEGSLEGSLEAHIESLRFLVILKSQKVGERRITLATVQGKRGNIGT